MDFEDQLAGAMRSSADTLRPPVPQLVAGGLARGRRARRRRLVAASAAAVVLLVVVAGGAVALRGRTPTTTAAAGSCRSVVRNDVLPVWARGGFSDPRPRVAHVMSADGQMVAILFGDTLHAPPSQKVNNKILWVDKPAQDPPADLRIDAVREGTTTHVRRVVPGSPGPSTIDLPAAGCWHLDLRWGSRHDTIDLVYERP